VASTEVPADEHEAPGCRYPVDDVREMTNCELHLAMKNMAFKVASGDALPCLPEALHHGNPIPAGCAHVLVLDIVSGFEDLDLDFATPEGDRRLGDVKRQIVLWQKKYIKFLGSAPRPPTPRNPSPPFPVNVVHLRHPRVHLGRCVSRHHPRVHLQRHVSRRHPRVHLGRRVSRSRPLVHLPRVSQHRPPVHLQRVRQSRPPILLRQGKSRAGPLRLVLLIR
jgi:hypothetical protein